jgi:hypothetical protein
MFLSVWEVVRTLFGAGTCFSARDTVGTMFVEKLLGCKGNWRYVESFLKMTLFRGVWRPGEF